jgi:plastocyanin
VLACEGESLKPPIVDPNQLYWELDLNHRAVTLATATAAPYDTLTLVATPRNLQGEALSGLPAPQFTSKDVERVQVTPDGVLHGIAATNASIWVIATLTVDNLKHTDSVLVRVVNTATPPVLASFSVHPVPPDSAKVSVSPAYARSLALGTPSSFAFSIAEFRPAVLPVQAADISGTPITGLPVYFRSSNPKIAAIDRVTGGVIGVQLGAVTLYASTTAFGVTKADTLPYRIGLPLHRMIALQSVTSLSSENPVYVFSPSEVTVAAGALIYFSNQLGNADTSHIDITFAEADLPNIVAANTWPHGPRLTVTLSSLCNGSFFFGPADCASAGNAVIISTTGPGGTNRSTAPRVFTTPGVYEYHSTVAGAAGRIIVLSDD